MRWNPSTKMVQVYDGGTWYDKEYYDPQWDGYIYNNGAYRDEYFNTTSICSSYAEGTNSESFYIYYHHHPANGQQSYSQLKLSKSFRIERPCKIHVKYSISGADVAYKGCKIGICSDNVVSNTGSFSGVYVETALDTTINVDVTKELDCSASNMQGKDVYIAFCQSAPGYQQVYNSRMLIKQIWVEYLN